MDGSGAGVISGWRVQFCPGTATPVLQSGGAGHVQYGKLPVLPGEHCGFGRGGPPPPGQSTPGVQPPPRWLIVEASSTADVLAPPRSVIVTVMSKLRLAV